MATYPASPAWSYPLTRTLEFETRIGRGEDSTEQRWPLHTGRESWTLAYPRLTLAERDILLAAFEAAKGSYDATLDFVFGGTTFTGCHFDPDKFSVVERNPLSWSASVTIRQVIRAADTGALPADFPALSSGALMQWPYMHDRAFDTVAVRTEGWRFAWYRRGTSLRVWSAGGAVLTDADALAIWDMFRRARGRWATFHFTDPDSLTEYTSCRFAEDKLEWRYIEPRVNAVEAQIAQFA